jgi:hypothetical protein
MHDILLPMPGGQARTAVCILRVEVESWGLVITMTANRDIANASTESVTRFSDAGEATAAVAAFLESFNATTTLRRCRGDLDMTSLSGARHGAFLNKASRGKNRL